MIKGNRGNLNMSIANFEKTISRNQQGYKQI